MAVRSKGRLVWSTQSARLVRGRKRPGIWRLVRDNNPDDLPPTGMPWEEWVELARGLLRRELGFDKAEGERPHCMRRDCGKDCVGVLKLYTDGGPMYIALCLTHFPDFSFIADGLVQAMIDYGDAHTADPGADA